VSDDFDGRKLVHHRCGYPFLTQIIGRFSWTDAIVIEYRDGRPGMVSIPLYHCPCCHLELKLWWDGPAVQSDGVDEELPGNETSVALS